MDFHRLPWIAMECHGLPCIAMDCHVLPWIAMNCAGLLLPVIHELSSCRRVIVWRGKCQFDWNGIKFPSKVRLPLMGGFIFIFQCFSVPAATVIVSATMTVKR
jgi:hypothetical protein